MSILYYLLIIIGALIVGGLLAFIFFFLITYAMDWRLKRKQKKITNEELKKPIKQELDIERGILTDGREHNEFREFEKLRVLTKGERRDERNFGGDANNIGEPKRSNLPNTFNFSFKPDSRNENRTKSDRRTTDFY